MPLLDEFSMGTFCTFDWSFAGRSQLVDTVAELLARHTQYYLFDSSYPTLEVDPFTTETTVEIHAAASTSSGPSMIARPRIRPLLPSQSPMKMERHIARSSAPLSMSQTSHAG